MIPAGQTELSVVQGFQALLPCAAQGSPEPRISWEKNRAVVPNLPGKFTVLRSGELIIERAEVSQFIIYTPYIVMTNSRCLDTDIRTILMGLFAQPGDAGVFRCVATNAAGSVKQDIRLSINMRPAFKELPGDVTLNKGQTLALSCHAQGTPTPLISWTANNRPHPGTPVHSPRLLQSRQSVAEPSSLLLTFTAASVDCSDIGEIVAACSYLAMKS